MKLMGGVPWFADGKPKEEEWPAKLSLDAVLCYA